MKKIVFTGMFAAIISAAAYSFATKSTDSNSVTRDAISLNVEAIASGESSMPVCTGPRPEGSCLCTNDRPCKDLYGCQ